MTAKSLRAEPREGSIGLETSGPRILIFFIRVTRAIRGSNSFGGAEADGPPKSAVRHLSSDQRFQILEAGTGHHSSSSRGTLMNARFIAMGVVVGVVLAVA